MDQIVTNFDGITNGIFQVYKSVGETPLDCLINLKDCGIIADRTKATYCGRLDPMAHGYLLIAVGDNLKDMENYNKDKKYSVSVLVGVSTDTTDCLGIINSVSDAYSEVYSEEYTLNYDFIKTCINRYSGIEYDQEYHVYSSKPVKDNFTGEKLPYWRVTKKGSVPSKVPSKKVKIHSIINMSSVTIKKNVLETIIMEDHLDKIKNGEHFRIDEIRESWKYFFENCKKSYEIIEFEATVSSGTYIRQLVKDISKDVGVPLMVIDLYRHEFNLTS